ncbi:hypothetical protein PG994_013264 [Apiospora phragmitis]|uniref:Uncharacterized protein n=1 Tax=Apiospora phragmitis TaxID=2905665 RepID=A0ABR1T856_9PEZI
MAASSASSSPLVQPASPGQQDDDTRPGAALIQARIMELQREQGYARFFFPDHYPDGPAQPAGGDTLVQIRFPNNSSVRCDGTAWSHVQLRMDAETLLATGSDVFKEKLVKVTPLMRERQQQDHTSLMLPESVEYILDLTPPDMGDESAALVSVLSVPESVRSWWQSGVRLNVKRSLVAGHDDSCPDHEHVPEDCERLPGVNSADIAPLPQHSMPGLDLDDIVEPVLSRQIPDYCPIRHRANIVFIMEAIVYGTAYSALNLLNSATRVYTVVKLAKILDCVGVVVDPVYTWALGHPSGNFIELLPEVSLELFWDLKVFDIVRSTFSILVVEGAIELLGAPADPDFSQAALTSNTSRIGPTTIFGRKRDTLPDDIANAIQHARDSVAERIHTTLAQIKSDAIYDFLSQDDLAGMNIPEWDHLSNIGETLGCTVPGRSAQTTVSPPVPVVEASSESQQRRLQGLRAVYNELASALVAYFHSQMTEALSSADMVFSKTDLDRKCYVPGSRLTNTRVIYERLTEEQRLLTVYPWYKMKTKAECDTQDHFFSCDATSGSNRAQLSIAFDQYLMGSLSLFPGLAPYRGVYFGGDEAFFNLEQFRTQYVVAMVSLHERRRLGSLVAYSEFLTRSQHMALGSAEEELRFLPIWAGGNDDDLGGVYDSGFVPDTAHGPSGPGPAFHTGGSVVTAASSIAPSTPTVGGTTTDDDDATTEGRSLAAAVSLSATVSSSSNKSTAASDHSQHYPSREIDLLDSDDFMLETSPDDIVFDLDLGESVSDDDFPLD